MCGILLSDCRLLTVLFTVITKNILRTPARTEEADKVSVRIAQLLSEKTFVLSPAQYISIHARLFEGVYKHAGKMRDYNITKSEWVLDGDTVMYGGALELKETLDYDIARERNFSYKGLSTELIIRHLAAFVSRLWQIHVFCEGNTRATAVFFIKYLHINSNFDAPKCSAVEENCTLDYTLDENFVLYLLSENPKLTQKQLAEFIKKSERTI